VEKYNDGKLHLISSTRLSKEKGIDRMIKLASILDKAGINYVWEVYTNRKRKAIGNNVIYKDSKLDIIEDIAKAHFLVQLSDCEAFCYSVVESLMVGTKVICTDLPVFKELGINEDNAIICNLDMKNVDVKQLTKYDKFTYNPPKDNWEKYLSTNKTYNPKEKIKAKALRKIRLIDEDIHCIKGQEIELTRQRASILEAKGYIEL
jgi:glycosyltransferase involved in cell wall biosynthesis